MRFLSNKEKKELLGKLPEGYVVNKKDKLKEDKNIIYNGENKLLIIWGEGRFLPHLKSLDDKFYKSVYVDKGAIPFIIKGADLMRPGIVNIEKDIKKDEVILVKDFEFKKTLAIGFSIFSSDDMESQEKGKSVLISHHIGDEYY